MNVLRTIEKQYWNHYIEILAEKDKPINPHIEAAVAGNIKITDDLITLYLIGKKTAGSSILEDFENAEEPIPQIGNYWIILDSKKKPKLIVKTKRIALNKFKDVPIEIAVAEGEGDLSLAYWKKTHSDIYAPEIGKWRIENINEATVITEFFEIVYQ